MQQVCSALVRKGRRPEGDAELSRSLGHIHRALPNR